MVVECCELKLCCFLCTFYLLYASRPHVTIPIYTPSFVSLFTDEGSRRLPKCLIYLWLTWLVCCKTTWVYLATQDFTYTHFGLCCLGFTFKRIALLLCDFTKLNMLYSKFTVFLGTQFIHRKHCGVVSQKQDVLQLCIGNTTHQNTVPW